MLTRSCTWGLCLILATTSSAATDWPPILPYEKEMEEVTGFPNAPAVVLLHSGHLKLDHRGVSSYLEVYRRIKVLTEEGREAGSVSLWANDFYRMKGLAGRTHLPDGTVIDLEENSQFEKEYSRYYNTNVLSFAMPRVDVGAIVEYRYRVYFDSVLYTQPWYFQSDIPTLRSEITCEFPITYVVVPYRVSPYGHPVDKSVDNGPKMTRVTYVAENLPPVPDEPFRYPFEDLSVRVLFLPRERVFNATREWLLKDWKYIVEVFQGSYGIEGYKNARKLAGKTKRKALALTEGLETDLDKARRLYRFVADEIITEWYTGVGIGDNKSDTILSNGRGDIAEKALLLQVLLDSVKLPSSLGWTNPRDSGAINVDIPNPWMLDHVIVVLDLDTERYFLDPSTPNLAFGRLPPMLENVPVLLVDKKQPEWVTSPLSTAQENQRKSRIDFEVEAGGLVSGKGELEITGNLAWQRIHWKDSRDETIKAWSDWLEEKFQGFRVGELELVESVPKRRIELSWKMNLDEAEALGDEVSIPLAEPLRLRESELSLLTSQRQAPALLDLVFTEEVTVHVRWPDGWRLHEEPKLREVSTEVGTLTTESQLPSERELTVFRRYQLTKRDFTSGRDYQQLDRLVRTVFANDRGQITLLKEDTE